MTTRSQPSMRDLLGIVRPLSESLFYRGPLKRRYATEDAEIVILKNPSKAEVERLRQRAKYREVRGLLDNDLLVWDAEIATHSDVASALRVDGSDLHLEPEMITVNDLPSDFTEDEVQATAKWIREHPAIISIYGNDVRLRLEAPDSGATWDF